MNQDCFPILPGYYAITERLTDSEIGLLNEGLTEYVMKNYTFSDCVISRINRSMWKDIWKYREAMSVYLVENGVWEE